MEHSSHGCSERVVVRVKRCRVVGAAPWSEFLGGSEQRFSGLVSENNQRGYRLGPHSDVSRRCAARSAGRGTSSGRRPPGWGTILCECLLAERTDPCREIGSGEAVGSGGQGNDCFGDPAHARLVEIDAADYDPYRHGMASADAQVSDRR